MASIPLPALGIRPVEQPDVMDQYAKLLQLKAMKEQMANAPLQRQAMEQELQARQLQNERQQQIIGNNSAEQQRLQAEADRKKQLDTIAMHQAQATRIGQIASTVTDQATYENAIKTAYSEQLLDDNTAQQYLQRGYDPTFVKGLQQQALTVKERLDQAADAIKQAEITRHNKAMEEAIATQRAETQRHNEVMEKKPTAASINLALGNATDQGKPVEEVAKKFGMSTTAFDQAAEKYWQSGVLPPIGRGNAASQALNKAIMNRAADLHPTGSLAANSAEFKSNQASLQKLQTNFDQVQAFEGTALKNIDLLQETAKKIPDLGVRFANVPARMISASMIGTENMAKFKTALNTAQTEAAKVLNSSTGTGILSDSARHELQQVIDGSLPYKAMVASLDTLRQDMANRTTAYKEQIADIKKRLGGGSSEPKAAPLTITLPSGKKVTIE